MNYYAETFETVLVTLEGKLPICPRIPSLFAKTPNTTAPANISKILLLFKNVLFNPIILKQFLYI